MRPDKIKQAFKKVKEDVFSLGEEINQVREDLTELKSEIKNISQFVDKLKLEGQVKSDSSRTLNAKKGEKGLYTQKMGKTPKNKAERPYKPPISQNRPNKSDSTQNSTLRHKNQTYPRHSTHRPSLEALRIQNMTTSTRNQGVSTDRQTDTRHINIGENKANKVSKIEPSEFSHSGEVEGVEKARSILDNLDSLKKELRRKFKKLTRQEMNVFSIIYQLEQQGDSTDYKTIASKMGLSQGTIRDYVYSLINKGIPLGKEKINNRKVLLHISGKINEIASLDTILKLREI